MVKGFSFEEEQAFRNSNQFIQPNFLRVAYILFILLFTLFGITDSVYFQDLLVLVYVIRFGIVIPTFIIVIVFTYMKSFVRIHQFLISTSALIGGLAVGFMLILNPDNIVYYGGLFLIYFSTYFIIKLRFVNASIVGWTLYVLHMIGYFIWNTEITDTFIYSSLFFIVANVLGMVGAYNIEVMNRKNFLHNQQISKLNDELKLNYDEKTAQLEQLEQSVKENKELIAINAEKDLLTETLLKSETRFRELIYNLNAGVIIYATDESIIDVNHRAFEILGENGQNIKGRKTKDFGLVFIDAKKNVIEADQYPLKRILASGKELKNLVLGIIKQDSSDISWIIVNGNPIFDSQGNILEVVISFIDYSELKNAQDQLIESEEQYKLLTTQMQMGMALQEIIYDENGIPIDYRYISVNDSYERLTGLNKEDIIGKNVLDIFPDAEESWKEFYRNVALTGKPHQMEDYTKTLDRYYRMSAYSPKEGMIAVILDDITEQKKLQKEQEIKEKDLVMSQRVAHIGTWRIDVNSDTIWWSEEIYKMFGFDSTMPPPSDDILKKRFLSKNWEAFHNSIKLCITNGITYELECEFFKNENKKEVGWMWTGGQPDFDENGNIVAVWGVAQDITEQKRQQYDLQKSEEKYKALATQMQLGLALCEVVLDDQGNASDYVFLEINDSYLKLFDLSRELCIGKKITEVTPEIEKYWIETLGNVAITGVSKNYESYHGLIDKYYSTYAYSPQKGQFAVIVTDITDQKKLEDALHDSNQKYMAIFEKSPISIEYYDANGNFIQANEECLNMFGVLDRDELIGYNLFDNPNLSKELLDKIGTSEPIRVEVEFSFDKVTSSKLYRTNKTGNRLLDMMVTPLMHDGVLNGYLVHIEDITIEKQKQKEIEYLSYHDYLTDLYNRRYFVHSYHQFIFEGKFPLGVMMIDINGLKIINDAYGHSQGDLAIRLVADLFRKVFEPLDVVARIGGDEFAILAPNKNFDQMQDYKNKIIGLVKDLNIGNIEISLAIGYEVVTDPNRDIDELLGQAENFLYRHKITVGTSIRNHAIKAILNTLTDKYAEEKVHSEKVSKYCKAIGKALGISEEESDVLAIAGMYHDIGKISIPDAILNKPGKLTNEEYEVIKSHTQVGYQILKAADEYSGLAEYALSHHERWDGKGYPKGLKGTEIPLYSRIINVADSFEAMTANRPYHKGRSLEEAIEEIKRCSGSQFDPEIAAVFIDKVLRKNKHK